MVDEKKEFDTWEEVIVDFLHGKKNIEEERYLKEEIKEISKLYQDKMYLEDERIAIFFESNKVKKIASQTPLEFLREKFASILELNERPDELDLDNLHLNHERKRKNISAKYEPRKWISMAATSALNISFATHVIKLTHSKINSSSLYDQVDAVRRDMLSTSSLIEKNIDGAISGNQYAPIFQFLELELNGSKLAVEFVDESSRVLESFTVSDEELLSWNNGFKKALSNEKLSTHLLAKQIYFPLIGLDSYHLLCNINSSSLAHSVFEKVFDKKQKKIRELHNKDCYSSNVISSFPQKSRLSVTASNHSNASQLNGKRGGKLHLFSNQPPTWQSQLYPPIHTSSLFDERFFYQNMNGDIDYLRSFLIRFENIGLSIENPKRRKWIEHWVDNITDELLFFTNTIQSLSPNWSTAENIKLKIEHQFLLDPLRQDEAFQSTRKAIDWQSVICTDFAHWLNRRLIGKDKKFTPQPEHRRLWAALLAKPLREHSEMLDIALKTPGEVDI